MQGRPNPGRFVAILLASVMLSSCIVDSAGVMTPEHAVPAPGITGAWISANGNDQALIARTGSQTYSVILRSKNKPDQVQFDAYLTPLDADRFTYILSMPANPREPKSVARHLFVLKLRTRSFELRDPSTERRAAIAAQAGVRLKGMELGPGATRRDVLKLMAAIAKPSFEGGYVYTRQGYFNDTPTFTLERTAALRTANMHTEAAGILAYLASRGSPEAQVRLAEMAAEGSGIRKDILAAAWFLLEAHRSGHPQAAMMLGTHLQKHGIAKHAVFKSPIHWFTVADVQSESPDARLAIEHAAKIECATIMAVPSNKWLSLADCTDKIGLIEKSNAKAMRDIERLQGVIADSYGAKQGMESGRAIDREIEETSR